MGILDYLPLVSENNRCVLRKDYPEGLTRVASSALKKLNWMFLKAAEELDLKQKKQILRNFTYEFDQDVFWGITRYEIGFYLILLILFMLHVELKTMGNKKNIFDFMHDSDGQRVNEEPEPQG